MPQEPPHEASWGDDDSRGMVVAELVAHASLRQPTMSMDDCYPEEMFWVSAGWFATAIMVWREHG